MPRIDRRTWLIFGGYAVAFVLVAIANVVHLSPIIRFGFAVLALAGGAVAVSEVNQDMSAYNIPGGAAAQVALYTPYWHHFAIIRRILLRMRSWQNYVFLEGH